MTLRISGVLLILLGLAIWTGRADAIIPVHEFLGFVLVLSLWTLAFLAARAGVQRGIVVAGFAGGPVAPRLCLARAKLLPHDWPWGLPLLHLLSCPPAAGNGEGAP